MKVLLIIWFGGGLGSVLRYIVQILVGRYITLTFPAGTFLVNITGCFAIGVLYAIADKYAWLAVEWRIFLVTGLCGGFTTFSGFSFESISLFRQGNLMYFILYILLSVLLGLLATILGSVITK